MLVRCPNCAKLIEAPETVLVPSGAGAPDDLEEVSVGRLQFQDDGTAYREPRPGEERHVDQRIRCPDCAIHQR